MSEKRSKIEQPHLIMGNVWFFKRGNAGGFGATYGVRLHKRTVIARIEAQAGKGRLENKNGVWYWVTGTNPANSRHEQNANYSDSRKRRNYQRANKRINRSVC